MADTDQVLNLAAIIRKVDGNHSKGAAALAESILDHPRFRAVLAGEPAVPEGKKPTRDELWELWLRLNNELPDRPAAVAEFWEHAQIDARARAALADGPAVPQGREPASVVAEPSDEELNRLLWYEFTTSTGHGERTDPIAFARAVLTRWGNPAPPADGEVAKLVAKLRRLAPQNPLGTADPTITRAADLLERQAPLPEVGE